MLADQQTPQQADSVSPVTATIDEQGPARTRRLLTCLLSQTAIQARRFVRQAITAVGARRHHYPVLAALEEFGPCSQAVLGRRCNIDRSDIAADVNELSAGDFIARVPDPDD